MKTIKVLAEIEVYNDPEFCEREDRVLCCPIIKPSGVIEGDYLCTAFHYNGSPELLAGIDRTKKCKRCKAAYQNAMDPKFMEPSRFKPCPICGSSYFGSYIKDGKRLYYCKGHHRMPHNEYTGCTHTWGVEEISAFVESAKMPEMKNETQEDQDQLSFQRTFGADFVSYPYPSVESKYITANLALGFTKSQVKAIDNAVHFWNQIILKGAPGGLTINFYVSNIDGEGGTYGMASPITLDRETGLPSFGMISLDAADLVKLEREGTLPDVIKHEICHVLGFGTLWEMKGLTLEFVGVPVFTGREAIKEMHYLSVPGNPIYVPVENRGGPGTKGSHWSKTTFRNFLMTGLIKKGESPVSKMTIASLKDLGYEVLYPGD